MKKLEKLSLRSKLTVLALQALAALLMTTQRVWAQQSYNSGNVSQWIEVNSWQQLCVGLATGGNIRLMNTVTAPSLSTPEYNYFTDFSVPRGKTVTLDLNGYNIDRNTGVSRPGSAIIVYGNLTVLDTSESGKGMITGGRTINGGGVFVGSGAKFTLEGGNISGNVAGVPHNDWDYEDGDDDWYGDDDGHGGFGAGVCVEGGGTFIMNGGNIYENYALYCEGGGVYVYDGGTFIMNDGTISRNETDFGGGVSLFGGRFEMNGGTISGNDVDTTGGGVYMEYGTFIMNGGTISDNRSHHGAGVSMAWGTFEMNGGSITENNAYGNDGGGIYLDDGTFTMKGGSITKNSAHECGGGVYVQWGDFIMKDGEIADNRAGNGGGMLRLSMGLFAMEGGSFSGNTANSGDGIFSCGGQFEISGASFINDHVYLGGGIFTVVGALDPNVRIPVETGKAPTESTPVTITSGLKGKGEAENFTCKAPYAVSLTESGEAAIFMTPHLYLADNQSNTQLISEAASTYSGQPMKATLTGRTLFKDGNWNTLCLPFDLALEGSALDGVEARTLGEATFNAGTLTLNFSEPVNEITAGTPYIIRWNDDAANIVSPVFNGVIINATEPARITPGLASGTTGDGCVTFQGIYDPLEIGEEGDNTKLYFSTDNTLYWPNGAMTFNPFRAYLQLNTGVANIRAYQINFGEDETTGIISLTPDPGLTPDPSSKGEGSDGWYTIDGRKLGSKPTQRGIYIYNGKKIAIK